MISSDLDSDEEVDIEHITQQKPEEDDDFFEFYEWLNEYFSLKFSKNVIIEDQIYHKNLNVYMLLCYNCIPEPQFFKS